MRATTTRPTARSATRSRVAALAGLVVVLAGVTGGAPALAATGTELGVEPEPTDPIPTPEEPDGESEPIDPEPAFPGGPGDLQSCEGQDAEGAPIDLCDHGEDPVIEPPPPVDPCEDTEEGGEPDEVDVQMSTPDGPLDLTAEVADCERPDERTPSFTG